MSNGSICSCGVGRLRDRSKLETYARFDVNSEPKLVKRYRNCVVLHGGNGWQDEVLIHHSWRK
jgi:hypothetical protein